MPRYIAKRVFKLDFLGEEWKECYLTFSSVSINENRDLIGLKVSAKTPVEITDITIQFLQDHFMEGVVFDDEVKKIMPLKKEDMGLLPSLIQERAILFLVGEPAQ